MSTLNKTFSVKNGIDVAGTVVLDSNRNLSNVNTAAGILTANNATLINAAISSLTGATITAVNNSITTANAIANQANTTANGAFFQANNAYTAANNAQTTASGAVTLATNANTLATQANTTANQAYNQANLAYAAANNAGIYAQPAYNQANNAYAQANLAYTQGNAAAALANTKLSSSGGAISGDLTISGNLIITGNSVTLNVGSVSTNDSILYLASNNAADIVDIGFIGTETNVSLGGIVQSGLILHAADHQFYLFTGYPGSNSAPTINVAAANVATLVANVVANSVTVGGQAVGTAANVTLAYNQANNALNVATAANTAVTGNINAQSATFAGSITINSLNVATGATSTGGTSQVVADQFAVTLFASARYYLEQNFSGQIHTTELIVVQDQTNVYMTELGTIQTNSNLGSFSATISGGNFQLLWTPSNSGTSLRFARYALPL